MVFPSGHTIEQMVSKIRMKDGICPQTYQWLYDETISGMHDEKERAGHIMCDELQLKSTLCWNTKTHELVGFATDSTKLDFLDELSALEKSIRKNGQSRNEDHSTDNKIAKK